MTNAQLVSYIQARLARGSSFESIRQTLRSIGWKEHDINEAISQTLVVRPQRLQVRPQAQPQATATTPVTAATTTTTAAIAATPVTRFKPRTQQTSPQQEAVAGKTTKPSRGPWLIAIALLVLAVIIIGGGILASSILFNDESPGTDETKNESILTQTITQTQAQTQTAVPIDCGTDFDCFIEASRTCTLANVTSNTTVNTFGMLQTTVSFHELKEGGNASECTFYTRTERVDLKFGYELVEQLKAGNATDEQIERQEEEFNQQADLAEGQNGTCIFETKDLTAMLNGWANGSVFTEDWAPANCSGELFASSFASEEASSSDAAECFIWTDCPENFRCDEGNCISNDVVNEFEDCDDNHNCSQECENCKKGKMLCMASGTDGRAANAKALDEGNEWWIQSEKCVECFSSTFHCREGYVCIGFKCVPEQQAKKGWWNE